MTKRINRTIFSEKLIKAGMTASALAEKLGVSRAAVSKWMNGESFPKPDKLLRIGMLLGTGYDELVVAEPDMVAEPVVAYRAKANRVTREQHVVWAKEAGIRLRKLADCLPNTMQKPPVLKEPVTAYNYVARVAAQVRREIKRPDDKPIEIKDLLQLFDDLHAVIIPVFWGDTEHHGNALHVYLPDSLTTWIWLNLDSKFHDFLFWMSHELGHAYAPDLTGDYAEDFADLFAQLLLFPASCVESTYKQLTGKTKTARWTYIRKEAEHRNISFYTIIKALRRYSEEERLEEIVFSDADISKHFAILKSSAPSVADQLFKQTEPTPKQYIQTLERAFKTPFFEALKAFNEKQPLSEHFLTNIMNIPLTDAKALAATLG
ncbi:MAG: helix-turn-helix transcriptional regulator [Verrucomicrobia bacterium]|nr:helix-turn-helix transcriptional regulator [Verrucomicrobiota bacterium]